jgi:hypothetical protein
LPNAVLKETKLKRTGFFSFSIGYLFDLQKWFIPCEPVLKKTAVLSIYQVYNDNTASY